MRSSKVFIAMRGAHSYDFVSVEGRENGGGGVVQFRVAFLPVRRFHFRRPSLN